MLNSARRALAIPNVPSHALLSSGILASFAWLLFDDRIHPVVVYLLQMYLTF
ncbi:MAG: hypothetical protein AAF772_09480 [Acidobacteriota bacterium]